MATGGGLLRSLGPNENLDIFDANNLQMNDSYRASCNAVIDRLVKFLQNNVPIKVKEVVKGGSLGKGTAIRDKSDIDLVLFLSDYHTVKSVKADMTQLLSTLENYLGRYGGCRVVGSTRFSIQVDVSCHALHEHNVDILPACDILGGHGTAAVYGEMARSEDLRHYYSASLVKLQLNFVKVLPTKVMSLIRLVKHWRKSELPSDSGKGRWPTSYILELIVIKKWEDAGRPERFDLKNLLHSFLQALVNYRDLKVVWYKNYDRLYTHHSPPYVIDPANPFNNVMDRCDVWDDVARYARDTLKWPLFRGI
ncbi:hypothetical protein CHS0354_026447 [Potamilus streckersoni]|uniref:Uncharacterized protein n=1 Tax=Potamilus streckersoni TaxID=2493646 RepID=A0AAE0RPS8_9BIVA|nr:hypothetical protein CHS0354_026447 [Potamilus streckersoni]